ncbi:efflux RND transporter periplasmic adaptor subunit [Actinoplanes sp. TFC3]|uniref:efflux RND transporter periplasmic adaptor subunit n=1 Tax=Actinoplanes sp. TFC3 TaxID=1710355 RepID=UPI000A438AC3|nr:efflux RND transporter periplasmic adaptor subunit [Actinoplanes sp. TFC3]
MLLFRAGAVVAAAALLAGCTSAASQAETPGLDPRGTVFTTVKPVKQDLTNRISLTGKVTIDPVFGIVAPAGGELRYLERQPTKTPVKRLTWVATVWEHDQAHRVQIPKGSTLAGRLLDDHAKVAKGMPVISAKHAGYGIVADISSDLAYRISGDPESVQGQIQNGPGPFKCKPLGTIAALPEGTIPAPPTTAPTTPAPGASGAPAAPAAPPAADEPTPAGGSDATGIRMVCIAPDEVPLINGASVTLDVVTDKASKVLVLPVEAVAGTKSHGKVDVVGADRERKTVDVTLGLTDGKVIEIKKGLTGSEDIAVPGPDLPAAPEGAGEATG